MIYFLSLLLSSSTHDCLRLLPITCRELHKSRASARDKKQVASWQQHPEIETGLLLLFFSSHYKLTKHMPKAARRPWHFRWLYNSQVSVKINFNSPHMIHRPQNYSDFPSLCAFSAAFVELSASVAYFRSSVGPSRVNRRRTMMMSSHQRSRWDWGQFDCCGQAQPGLVKVTCSMSLPFHRRRRASKDFSSSLFPLLLCSINR